MKKLVLKAMLLGITLTAQATKAEVTGLYGMHLFFNEKEFIDTVQIVRLPNGQLTGHMDVPQDFKGKLLNIQFQGQRMVVFDLVVPKNPSRPQEMIFNYKLLFFDSSHNQFIGFVTIKNQPGFTASFVGFKKTPERLR